MVKRPEWLEKEFILSAGLDADHHMGKWIWLGSIKMVRHMMFLLYYVDKDLRTEEEIKVVTAILYLKRKEWFQNLLYLTEVKGSS